MTKILEIIPSGLVLEFNILLISKYNNGNSKIPKYITVKILPRTKKLPLFYSSHFPCQG